MTLTEFDKHKIVILYDEGYTIDEIATKMNINRKTVMKWKNRFNETKNVQRKEGSGRKSLLTNEDNQHIIDLVRENNDLSIKELCNKLEENNIMISKSMLHTKLIDNGFSYKNTIKKPLLTEEHKKKRLDWALKYKKQKWDNVLFSDETMIRISGGNKKKWIHKNDIVIERSTKYPLKKNIWGCFYKGAIGPIYIFSEIMTAAIYVDILNENLIPFLEKSNIDLIYQHDNDPKHTASLTIDFLNDNNITVIEWPSCSPDLNPIENLWSILKEKVRKCKSKNTKEFCDNIQNEWNKIDPLILESLINSMPKRIQQLIENEGDYIMY